MKRQIFPEFERNQAAARTPLRATPIPLAQPARSGVRALPWHCAALVVAGILFLPALSSAATNDLATTLQKGLFEEEANHNLGAAIKLYQSVISQFDKDRKLAATAVFRLAECYRKQGNTNEANAQYDRVLREFADQTPLVSLSRQNLAALGGKPTPSTSSAVFEAAALKTKLEVLGRLRPDELRIAILQEYPNPVLTSLMQKLMESEQNLAAMRQQFGASHSKVVEEATRLKTIDSQIDAQVRAVLKGLDTKVKDAETRAEALAKAGVAPAAEGVPTAQPSTSVEAEEVRRIQAMIKDSPDLINAKPEGRLAPLQNAAQLGHLIVAQFLVENGADVEAKNPADGWRPIHYAASCGHKAILELLLAHKARVDAPDGTSGRTPLHLAAQKGFRSIVQLLLDHGAAIDARDIPGGTPLHYAVGNGFRAVAELLLSKGANPKISAGGLHISGHNVSGTPLHLAVDRGDSSLLELLLANKADPNQTDPDGSNPLDMAAGSGKTALAEKLIARGAEVNAKNEKPARLGWTALHHAVIGKQKQSVDLLLKHKADPNARVQAGYRLPRRSAPPGDEEVPGYTPLLMACANNSPEIVASLLAAKADPNLQSQKGDTAIINTMQRVQAPERARILALLLEHGADPNTRDMEGMTPLMLAAQFRDKESLGLLLASKADPKATVPQSAYTALHILAFYLRSAGSTEQVAVMAEQLIAAGADVNAQDYRGKTPLNYATELLASRTSRLRGPGGTSQGATQTDHTQVFAEVLRKAGALEDLARMDVIEVRRRSGNFSSVVFSKGTNDYNHFTLFELIGAHYGFISANPSGQGNARSGLQFPDFANVVIRRPKPDRTQWTSLNVNVAGLFEATFLGDCSKDEKLQWGDVVEIPEADHPINARWQGLPERNLSVLQKCLSRQVTVTVKGSTTNMNLNPVLTPPLGPANGPSFMLVPVLYQSGMLRASSDPSRVKVTRHDPASGQRYEMVLDCTPNNSPDLWLRHGDAIEVPEKTETTRIEN